MTLVFALGCRVVRIDPLPDEDPSSNTKIPPAVPGYSNVFKSIATGGTAVTTSGRFSCGVTFLNQVICWGSPLIGGASTGHLGNPFSDEETLLPVLGGEQGGEILSGVSKVAAGRAHACGLTVDGSVYCWGFSRGLGNGINANVPTPTRVIAGEQSLTETYLSNIVEIGAGFDYTCALSAEGHVYCWSRWDNGTPSTGVPSPRKLPLPEKAMDIAGQTYYSAISERRVYLLETNNSDLAVTEIDTTPVGSKKLRKIPAGFQSYWVFDEEGRSFFFGQSYFKTYRNQDGTFLDGEEWDSLLLVEYLY